MATGRVLVADDEAAVRFGIRRFLESHGYEVDEADSCEGAYERCRACRPDAAIVDYRLPDGTALDLLPRLKEIDSSFPVVVVTAHAAIDLAVRAIKEGAEQFLTKPVELPTLLVVLERLLEDRARRRQLASRPRHLRREPDPFLGASRAIRDLADEARKLVASDSPILILGETGSGKGVLAHWLHDQGPRASDAFVDLNCAGLSREFLETELFGHEKGAFTGAVSSKVGLLEIAHRGTLFLDEIGDVDPQVQPKLLKVVEEKRFRRLGDVRDRQVNTRLIAATHQDLEGLVRDKRFRADLYFRISTLPLIVPPLRSRPEDIPLIADRLLAELAGDIGRASVRLLPDAVEALQAYAWPGNIRELRNVLERALLLTNAAALGRRDLRFAAPLGGLPAADHADVTLAELERRHVERVFQGAQRSVSEAARRLGIPRSTLYVKLKAFGLSETKAPGRKVS
jgi:DNA-binding NtrC family response regulator